MARKRAGTLPPDEDPYRPKLTPQGILAGPDQPPPFPRPQGRPTEFDQGFANEVCERIANGEGLREICTTKNRPMATVLNWVVYDLNGFADQYAKACISRAMIWAEEIQTICDDGRNDWMERNGKDSAGWMLNGEHIARSRLRVDTRKWFLSKLLPKVFGDKLALTGADGGAIKTESTLNLGALGADDRDVLRSLLQAATPEDERETTARRMQ